MKEPRGGLDAGEGLYELLVALRVVPGGADDGRFIDGPIGAGVPRHFVDVVPKRGEMRDGEGVVDAVPGAVGEGEKGDAFHGCVFGVDVYALGCAARTAMGAQTRSSSAPLIHTKNPRLPPLMYSSGNARMVSST